jgi:hypothetical protein
LFRKPNKGSRLAIPDNATAIFKLKNLCNFQNLLGKSRLSPKKR